MGLGGLSVQDSELVSQAFAQCAITNNPKVWLAVRPAGNPWLLVARRYGRRFYLPLLAVIIVCLSLSMAPTWPQVAVVVFLLAWSISWGRGWPGAPGLGCGGRQEPRGCCGPWWRGMPWLRP